MRLTTSSLSLALLAIRSPSYTSAQNGTETCSPGSFSLKIQNDCSFSALEAAYLEYLADPVLDNGSCGIGSGSTVSQELGNLLGGLAPGQTVEEKVRSLCLAASEITLELPSMSDPAKASDKFLSVFYQEGGTDWNEETQTGLDAEMKIVEPNGSTQNNLKEDAENVPITYEHAERYKLNYPEHMTNFESCEMNAVMCCWVTDRQANDANGNCATPYDTNCVDKDPADNTDLCAVHHDGKEDSTIAADGISTFEGGNNDGEGPVHCHGFAWSNDELDMETRFKGNNLFYVSMYDHMYQRGYVRNVPFAPMCACLEQMPVVTRSDCTQTDVRETYNFDFDALGGVQVSITNINVNFNACRGKNNRNNDLSAYMDRLYDEGKLTREQRNNRRSFLVENNNCPREMERSLASKGIVRGASPNIYPHSYAFPPTDTDLTVHAFCVTGAGEDGATAFSSNDFDLKYTLVPPSDFVDGVKAWGNRDYTLHNIENSPCAGGLYLRPNVVKEVDRYTDINIAVNPADGVSANMCILFFTYDPKHGRLPEKLFYEGFDKFVPDMRNKTAGFHFKMNGEPYLLTAYCKDLPATEKLSPSLAPTVYIAPNSTEDVVVDTDADTYIRGGTYEHINFGSDLSLPVKNSRNSDYDRHSLLQFDARQLKVTAGSTDRVHLRLFVKNSDAGTHTLTVSKLSSSFDEGAITSFTKAPIYEGAIAGSTFKVSPEDVGTWIQVDVTDIFIGHTDDLISMSIRIMPTNEKFVSFGTRENGEAAQLVKSIYPQSYSFPSTDTTQLIHALCATGVGSDDAAAFSSNADLNYQVISQSDFVDGIKVWGDRTYTLHNIDTSPCAGGVYLQPSLHVNVARYTDIIMGIKPAETTGKICAIFQTHDTRHGRLPEKLYYDGFTKTVPDMNNVTNGFHYLVNNEPVALTTYCKELPAQAAPSPTLAPTVYINPSSMDDIVVNVTSDTFVRGGTYQFVNYGSDTSIVLKNSNDVNYDRHGLLQFDARQVTVPLNSYDRVTLRLFVMEVTDSTHSLTISKLTGPFDEGAITWEAYSSTILSNSDIGNSVKILPQDEGHWVEVDITNFLMVHASDMLTLGLRILDSTNKGLIFGSRESGFGPQLIYSHYEAADGYPFADAFVRGGDYANENYGEEEVLISKQAATSNDRKFIIEFDIGFIDTSVPVPEAILRLYSSSGPDSPRTIRISRFQSATNWTETSITWNVLESMRSAAVAASTLDTGISFIVQTNFQNDWVEVDITSYVSATLNEGGNRLILFFEDGSSSSSGSGIIFHSREGVNSPRLHWLT